MFESGAFMIEGRVTRGDRRFNLVPPEGGAHRFDAARPQHNSMRSAAAMQPQQARHTRIAQIRCEKLLEAASRSRHLDRTET
jgi:hypothetical protein